MKDKYGRKIKRIDVMNLQTVSLIWRVYVILGKITTGNDVKISCVMTGENNRSCSIVVSGKNLKFSNRPLFRDIIYVSDKYHKRSAPFGMKVHEFAFDLFA